MMDPFSLLNLFVAIAETGSLSAAARAKGFSPSTVTLSLQRLEEKVGARLATRTTRRLSLTPEGERFLADCRRILADLGEAMNSVADGGALRGDIRVTATNDFGRTRLAPLIGDFMQAHPGVRIELMLSDAVVDLVEEGYDLGIRTGPLRDSSLAARLLIRGGRFVCASPGYWRRYGKPAHPRDLAGHNCLVLARPGAPQASWYFREGERRFGVRVSGDRMANDGGALRHWALAGAGVVLKSHFDVEADLAAGRLETALDGFMREEVNLYAIHPLGAHPARRVQVFLDYLAARLADRTRT